MFSGKKFKKISRYVFFGPCHLASLPIPCPGTLSSEEHSLGVPPPMLPRECNLTTFCRIKANPVELIRLEDYRVPEIRGIREKGPIRRFLSAYPAWIGISSSWQKIRANPCNRTAEILMRAPGAQDLKKGGFGTPGDRQGSGIVAESRNGS